MARIKQASKKSRRSKALPFLGAAGASLAITGGASASAVPTADLPSQGSAFSPVVVLGDEEFTDVSLGTFYVLDQEESQYLGVQLAQRCGRGGGGGCGGCRGCGGAGRCGGGGCAVARCGGGGGCAAVARCGGVGRCAVVGRCRCGARCGCGCGVGVVGCAGCGCTCSGCTGPCWSILGAGWAWVC
jgi:hypothetical protein